MSKYWWLIVNAMRFTWCLIPIMCQESKMPFFLMPTYFIYIIGHQSFLCFSCTCFYYKKNHQWHLPARFTFRNKFATKAMTPWQSWWRKMSENLKECIDTQVSAVQTLWSSDAFISRLNPFCKTRNYWAGFPFKFENIH